MSIYHSIQGKEQILKIYDQNWAALGLELEHSFIQTRHGKTHLVTTGPSEAQPIVVFHGGNMISPISFAWIAKLTDRYRIYAPDTVGHPGYSDESRLNPRTFQYGQWAADVIDSLKVDEPVVMGCSYGGGILLNLAAYAPAKIGKAILVVPSGLTPLPLLPMVTRIGFPLLMYRMTRKHSWLIRNLSALYPNPSERFVEATSEIYQHVKLEAGMPRTIRREELKDFRAPTLVLAGEDDILFPASAVISRSRAAIPSLVAAEALPDSSHFLPPRVWDTLCERIDRFIQQGK